VLAGSVDIGGFKRGNTGISDIRTAYTEIPQYITIVLGVLFAGSNGFGLSLDTTVDHVIAGVGDGCSRRCYYGKELYEEGKDHEYQAGTADTFLAPHALSIKTQLVH